MQTSCYSRLKTLPADARLVAVSRTTPKTFKGEHLAYLAPSVDWIALEAKHLPKAIAEYQALLDSLSPDKLAADLGDNAVILSWEGAGFASPRRALAEHLEGALKIEIPEAGFTRDLLLTLDKLPPPRGYDILTIPWDVDCDHCGACNAVILGFTSASCGKCHREFGVQWD